MRFVFLRRDVRQPCARFATLTPACSRALSSAPLLLRHRAESFEEKRELVFKEDGQEYAQVLRMLGNGRLEAYCYDGKKRLCHIRGKMRKRVWVGVSDIVLISLREFQDAKADVIMKYTADEARNLKVYKELPETAKIGEGDDGADAEDDAFEFDAI